jgi:hypothetical protein
MEFDGAVNRDVTPEMLEALHATIARNAIAGETIDILWVSSARDQHACPSRHVTGNGVDISRINGKKIGTHYTSDPSVKAIVDGLQTRFEGVPRRRENFGPTIQRKLGKPYPASGHQDHFHWSVDGDHSACAPTFLERVMHVFGLGERADADAATSSGGTDSEICNV